MNNSKFAGTLIIFCVFFLTACSDQKNPEKSFEHRADQSVVTNEKTSLKTKADPDKKSDSVSAPKQIEQRNLKCIWSNVGKGGGMTITTYVSGDREHQEVAFPEGRVLHTIESNNARYVWYSDQREGEKSTIETRGLYEGITQNMRINGHTCEAWKPVESVFELPSDINFVKIAQ